MEGCPRNFHSAFIKTFAPAGRELNRKRRPVRRAEFCICLEIIVGRIFRRLFIAFEVGVFRRLSWKHSRNAPPKIKIAERFVDWNGREVHLSLKDSDAASESHWEGMHPAVNPAAWNRAFRYAHSLVRDKAEAEDLTQEAFVVLFREQRAGRPVEWMNAWMRTVIRHLAYQRRRKERPELHVPLEESGDQGYLLLHDPAAHAPSPEQRVIDDAMLHLSAKVLGNFSARERESILMYFRGYDFLQIGKAIGVSRWTARRTTLKALKAFLIRMNEL
jgi:RNA polymerase sigma factor (sigma-70 family)